MLDGDKTYRPGQYPNVSFAKYTLDRYFMKSETRVCANGQKDRQTKNIVKVCVICGKHYLLVKQTHLNSNKCIRK